MSAGSRSLEIVFIRHAESEENVKAQYFHDLFMQLFSFKCPTWNQIVQCISLMQLEVDPQLSPLGKRQLLEMNLLLRNRGFWEERTRDSALRDSNGSDEIKLEFNSASPVGAVQWLVAYSPLQRAKDTCFALLPDEIRQQYADCGSPISRQPQVVCAEALQEIHPLEQLYPPRVREHLNQLEKWIQTAVLEHPHLRCLVLVGHCQIFNQLLRMKTRVRNCDVWRATYRLREAHCERWSELKLLHRSSLTLPHPLDRLKRKLLALFGYAKKKHIAAVGSSIDGDRRGTASGSDDIDEDDDDDDDDDFITYESMREPETTSAASDLRVKAKSTAESSNPYSLHGPGSDDGVADDLDDDLDEPMCRICQVLYLPHIHGVIICLLQCVCFAYYRFLFFNYYSCGSRKCPK